MLKKSKITFIKQLEIWEQAVNTKNYEYDNDVVIVCITILYFRNLYWRWMTMWIIAPHKVDENGSWLFALCAH